LRRIAVVGTSGSGKTSFAAALAARLGVPHIELDALHWEPNWTEAETPVFRARVAAALAADSWVVDGNYTKARDLIWPRAEALVWLDYPLPLVLWRLARRTSRRALTRQTLWSGNRERLSTHLFTRDSLFLWALQTHRRHRRRYPIALTEPAHAHLHLFRFRSPRAAAGWLGALPNALPRAEG
jgi:adenylate kinase family enzyme